MRYTIHERKSTSLKHVLNGVTDMYNGGDSFIMLEFLFYIIFVPFERLFLLDYWNFMMTSFAALVADLFLFS